MSVRLVHIGKGRTRFTDDGYVPPWLQTVPKAPQVASQTIRNILNGIRDMRAMEDAQWPKHGIYKPAPLIMLAQDQCRYPIDGELFCGAHVSRPGSSWCEAHRAICFTGRFA